jgi:hypothetical protein
LIQAVSFKQGVKKQNPKGKTAARLTNCDSIPPAPKFHQALRMLRAEAQYRKHPDQAADNVAYGSLASA